MENKMRKDKWPYLNTLIGIRLNKLGKAGKCVIDIGACVGDTIIEHAERFPNKIFHAIEPLSYNYKELINRTKGIENVIAHKMAITNRNGTVPVFSDRNGITQSSSLERRFVFGKNESFIEEEVTARTFGTFCRKNKINDIGLLIMNCEGGEYTLFEDESFKESLDMVRILNVALHGKEEPFIGKKYREKKININKFLKEKGFSILYGDDLEGIKRVLYGHIVQIWVK